MAGDILSSVTEAAISISSGNSTNQVPWQTAFLGLLPLALNAMTQPSSLDFNLPESSLLFMARSSPFICVADTLEIFIALCFYMYQEGNIFEATRLVNWRIARARLGSGVSELEASAVEKHPKTFMLLFLATLVPAIKLLGLQGIPWTKAWAGIYLCSFVVLAIVRALAPEGWRDSPPPAAPPKSNRSFQEKLLGIIRIVLLVVAGAVHAFVSCWALIKVRHDEIFKGPLDQLLIMSPIPFIMALIIPCVLAAYSPWLMYYHFMGSDLTLTSIRYTTDSHEFGSYIWMPIVATGLLISGVLSLHLQFNHIIFDLTYVVTFIILCFGLLFLLFTIMSVLSRKVPFLSFLKFNDGDYRALLVFPFFNFIVALLYYRYAYDPTGTVKPLWTEELG